MSFRIDALLAATDLTSAGKAAIAAAAGLASLTGARLHIVHAIENDGSGVGSPDLERARDGIRQQIAVTAPSALANAAVHVAVGAPHEAILQWAEEVGANLIIIGPHRGEGPSGGPLGSVADQLVRKSDIPCLIVRGPLTLPLRRVVVPSDLSEAAQGAMDVGFIWGNALRIPRATGSSTTLEGVHVAPSAGESGGDPSAETALREQMDAAEERTGARRMMTLSATVLRNIGAEEGILGLAAETDADLVVLGTHGRSARGRSEVGSVSSAVARATDRPVLLVPPGYWKEWQKRNALLEQARLKQAEAGLRR